MTNNTTANDTKKFSGICQVCGRRQAVNAKGNIAKHGYTLDYGFFNGTCQGSDNLPFEQSKELAESIIADVHDAIERLGVHASKLEAPATPEADGSFVAWVHEYKPASWARGDRRSGYLWRHVPVTFETSQREVGRYEGTSLLDSKFIPEGTVTVVTKVRWTGKDGKAQSTDTANYSEDYRLWTAERAVTKLNTAYAKTLRQQAQGLATWIKWQEERCAKWTLLPLEPRK